MPGRAALLTLLLAGCASAPAPKPAPDVVRVPVEVPAAIPAALTEPCPVAQPGNDTVEELLRVAQARGVSLTQCANPKLKAIRDLGAKKP